MSERLNITKGEAKIQETTSGLETTVNVGKKRVAQFKSFGKPFNDATKEERIANTNLYVDSHNTYNKCEKLPSELLAELEYWAKRCELMEKCENESPCGPDVTDSQIEAWKEYHNFIGKFGTRDYPTNKSNNQTK